MQQHTAYNIRRLGESSFPAQPNLQDASVPLRLWPAIILTGVGAGLAGGLLMKLLGLVQHLCFRYDEGDFLGGVTGVPGSRRVVVLILAGLIAGIVLLLVHRISDHDGPGLNKAIWKYDGDLPSRSMSVRTLLSIVIVGMGAALGRESALKMAGGLIGKRLSGLFQFTPEQRQLLVACGTGAGMAAAYNVPLGGALFTMEVLLGRISMATALPAFATSFIATAVAWTMLPNQPTYVLPYLATTQSLTLWAVFAGPLLGLGSVAFVRGVKWAESDPPRSRLTIVLTPLLVFTALGLASVFYPQLLGNGKNVVQLLFDARITGGLLALLVVLRPLATIACLRSGAPGGLFTPTMTFGALLGAFLGDMWSYIDPGADKRSCAVIGSGAVLAAATQAPISSVTFVLELTYNTNTLMVPLLLAVAGATITYRCFESSSY